MITLGPFGAVTVAVRTVKAEMGICTDKKKMLILVIGEATHLDPPADMRVRPDTDWWVHWKELGRFQTRG